MTALTDQLAEVMRRTDLPAFVRRLNDLIADEARRREQFRADLGVKFKHGEFINGEVVLPSPMKYRHRRVITRLGNLLDEYVQARALGVAETNGLLIETTRNDYEPDVYFWPKNVSETFTAKQDLFPPPLFAAEVLSPSTEKRDRGIKFEDYAAHGVAEYWIVDPEAESVECYVLSDKTYVLREKVSADSGAMIRSVAIDGFAIPVEALFDDDANRAALERMRTEESQ